MDMSWLMTIGPYHWMAVAAVLIGLEMVMPTQYLIWPGIAAAATALLALSGDVAWTTQVGVFAVLSAILVGVSFYLPKQKLGDVPALNQRTDHIVGKFATVAEDFRHGEGAVTVGDTRWSAASVDGSDLTTGTRVEVVAAESTLLKVKRAG
jgi:membrane protein implicated in regulation of membrane protease activity